MKRIFRDTDSKYFWDKKVIVSYFLSVLVFFIHLSSPFNYDNSTGGFVSSLNNTFIYALKDAITPIAVVLFFIISGFLFFRNFDISRYFNKLKSRMRSLLIPYLFWNTVWTLFLIVTSYTFISNFFIGREKFELSVANIFKSIFLYAGNNVFWFVFDLIIFVIVSPLIYCILKNKYLGLICIIASIVLLQFGIKLPEIFCRADSIVYFMIGSYYGLHGKKIFMLRTTTLAQILYGIIFAICVFINYLIKSEIITLLPALQVVFLFVFAISFWRFSDIFVAHIKNRPFLSRSFMVYAMHENVAAVISKLLYIILPKSNIFCIPNSVLTIVITLVAINYFCVLVNKISPKFYKVISGGR